jgi:crossover junction endodeoxyribonuclease RusA
MTLPDIKGRLRFIIPAPCEWITANQRAHRMEKARRTKLWRTAARAAANGIEPFTGPVHIYAHVVKPRQGRWDPLNWADTAKAAVDGLVDAQLLADDDHLHVLGPDMRRGDPGPNALVLTITPL